MKKTEEEYYNTKGGCVLMGIKLMIVVFIFAVLFGCEKSETLYLTVNVKTKNPDMFVSFYHNGISIQDSNNNSGMNYTVSHDNSKSFYFWVKSSDSINVIITHDIDTLINKEGYKRVVINQYF